jgi:hypothetical protein
MTEVHEFKGRKFRRNEAFPHVWEREWFGDWRRLVGAEGSVLSRVLDDEFPLPWTPSVGDEVRLAVTGVVKWTILALYGDHAWIRNADGEPGTIPTDRLVPWDGDGS